MPSCHHCLSNQKASRTSCGGRQESGKLLRLQAPFLGPCTMTVAQSMHCHAQSLQMQLPARVFLRCEPPTHCFLAEVLHACLYAVIGNRIESRISFQPVEART